MPFALYILFFRGNLLLMVYRRAGRGGDSYSSGAYDPRGDDRGYDRGYDRDRRDY